MKKLVAIIATVAASAAYAGHGHHHHGPTVGGHGVWPLIIGGTIGYVIANQQRPVIVQQPPVIVQQPPVYNNSPGVYNLPTAPYTGATPLYERRNQWDPACNCYVVIYNQIGWQ